MTKSGRAFAYRGGVRIEGTVIACDAARGTDLTFVSSAIALRELPRGRARVLATESTLALLGRAGKRLRPTALVAAAGRPFGLGNARLEVFPSGVMPGAASLLVEIDGRRIVYAGAVRPEAATGVEPMGVRRADALCLWAGEAAAQRRAPSPGETLNSLVTFVRGSLAAGRSPVLLAQAMPVALEVAGALAAAGIRLRAHRSVMTAAAAYRAAGHTAAPLGRFAGRLSPEEALLWSPDAAGATQLGSLRAPSLAVVGIGATVGAAAAGEVAGTSFALAQDADGEGLLAYARATGATDVAVIGPSAATVATALRAAGTDAYVLGPPEQMTLAR